MDCSYCKKPMPLLFQMIENKPGAGELKRAACFPCLSDLGEKTMREHREKQATQPPPATQLNTPSNLH